MAGTVRVYDRDTRFLSHRLLFLKASRVNLNYLKSENTSRDQTLRHGLSLR